MFVLDTNVVSELRRPQKAAPEVLAWASAKPLVSFFLSSITVLELELGTLLMERKDAKQGAVLRAWIDRQVLPHGSKGGYSRLIPLLPDAAPDCMCLTPVWNVMR
jgi:hypothetical protein